MKLRAVRSPLLAFILCCGTFAAPAQSTDQNFPSPVTTSEISGTIKVRDIGDSRVTSYYYAFDGGQGDIFINAVTRNFSGDIDIFTGDEMRPLTKMVIYADSGSQETGRLIYLRKSERLILRVEGRSPNDDPASFRIKFGGSFIALAPEKTVAEPTITTTETNESGIHVNSVGTIIKVVPKPQPVKPPPTVAMIPPRVEDKPSDSKKSSPPRRKKPAPKPGTVFENDRAKVVVEPAEKKPEAKPPARTKPPVRTETAATKPPPAPESPPDPSENPLASIWLVIELKDGNTIRRPMSEVTKFNVEKGTLVVVAKNGKIVRYRILEVAKLTIQ